MKTVLVIDDDPHVRRVVAEYLESKSWEVIQAADGDEGVAIAEKRKPQAIICDLLMPRGNGYRVCKTLRSKEDLRSTRIVVISGRDYESDRHEALRAGADAYFVKPLRLEDLEKGLGAGISSGQMEAAAQSTGPASSLVNFWGVRGSIPAPGPSTVRYGGNTTCVEVRSEGEIIILDAGTGLRLLGRSLVSEFADRPVKLTLLLTHTHWDHIQGLPFFLPLLRQENELRILGYEGARDGLDNLLTGQMESPFFPIGMRELDGNIQVIELKELEFRIGKVRVTAAYANHPGICVGYRLFTPGGSIAFFPDNEPHLGRRRWPLVEKAVLDHAEREHEKLVSFLQGTEVLIMDSQYTCEEYLQHPGWGHGCVEDVVKVAIDARAKTLVLFHHDPDHDDDTIDRMTEEARRFAAEQGGQLEIVSAREGSSLELPH